MRLLSRVGFVLSILVVAWARPSDALPPELSCLATITKEGDLFLVRTLSAIRGCRDAELKLAGSCAAPSPGVLADIDERLADRLGARCLLTPPGLTVLGFPGPCVDAYPGDGFTVDDLTDCLRTSHQAAVDAIVPLLYDAELPPQLPFADRHCETEVARRGAQFADKLLRAVQKCRTSIVRGKISGIQPERCATDYAPTRDAIAKAERKARHLIDGRCSDAQADRLRLCEPNASTVQDALNCLLDGIRRRIDNPDPAAPSDVIDFEFAGRPAADCGDDQVNRPEEECDGSNDGACPGACGAANGLFPCLCLSNQRQRVVEHAGADLDLWSSGLQHDADVVEGSGYLADVWDCDGVSGPDTECVVGPSCSLAPHSPCSPGPSQYVTGDSLCAGLGQGFCRKSAGGATGPHCRVDFQQRCDSDVQCPVGDACVKTLHGPPQPLSMGGVSVCLVNVLSEDVVGTTDLATGAGTVRLHQRSMTYLAPDREQPCPICGGFCAGAASVAAPDSRPRCQSDADCTSPPYQCVTSSVCSYGANVDGPCRPNVPFGGSTSAFGTTSVDCLPPSGANISGAGLDVLENPRSTGTVTLTAHVSCTAPEFAGTVCLDGSNDGRACGTALDCPGGACGPQCFCPGQAEPNACAPACAGGANDATPCADDSDCPGGFCHAADCRLDPSDSDSCQEGRCTVGPITGTCSSSAFQSCQTDADCQPPACSQCEPGEVCQLELRQCFVNGRIERCGEPGRPDRTTAAVYCVPGTGNVAVDATVGAPGPAALTQPETAIEVGF